MVHLMDADGVRRTEEGVNLRRALSIAYGIRGAALGALLTAGEEADQNARVEFIGILWNLVYADGELHELEDNIVWRVAELIGVESRDRIAARQRARQAVPGARGEANDD